MLSILTRRRRFWPRRESGQYIFDILYLSPAPPEWATILQIYQADLATIGVDVALKPLASAALTAARNAYDFDLVLTNPGSQQLLPQSLLMNFTYSPDRNSSGFKDGAYSQLVNQILAETDANKLHAFYGMFNDYILDQAFPLHIVRVPEHVVAQKNIRGLRFDLSQRWCLQRSGWLDPRRRV